MESSILLVTSLRSSLGLSGTHDGVTVADIRHPDAVENALASLARSADAIMVTCAAPDLDEVRQLMTFASIRFPDMRTCIEPIIGPPLALGVISSLVDDVSTNADENEGFAWQLSAMDYLRTRVWSGVWLPSVAKLIFPSPSILQHVRSWLPDSGFLAVFDQHPRVIGARRAPIEGLQPRPDAALIHSPSAGNTWVVDAVKTALDARSVSEMTSVREPVDSFDIPDAVEFVSVPLSFYTDSRPRPEAVHSCQGCGLHHARVVCPLCKMSTPMPYQSIFQGAQQ